MIMADSAELLSAYEQCEKITREQARNFSWGIRLLPTPKRRALSAVYAVARRIDDIGDGTLPVTEKQRLLADAREGATQPRTRPDDPVLVALDDAASRLPIPLDAFGELVDGCEMDVRGRTYDDLDELVDYCRCVAGSIGRLSLGVFDPRLSGNDRDRAARLADALGVALQLTNILRDVREDLGNDRVYLPKRDLDLFDCQLVTLPDGSLDPQDGRLAELIRFEAARAWGWYDDGLRLLGLLDRRSAACCAAMAGIYRELLARIAADPSVVLRGRASLPTRDKLRVAAGALAGRTATGQTVVVS
ncbi:MAG: 15-cis-phytoene synthase [Pseudonocardiales bacterium]|jgi:phytoene synthase|nr:15-cis-phytoene synthase [Pseudonocardiales bacterium]MDT4973941.1 15-cis-phytoene synthase [Pseudonocardiales bacterium]MDT4979213.1 15-cis-phytoene synthase [Pseudonocardiales bacterium]